MLSGSAPQIKLAVGRMVAFTCVAGCEKADQARIRDREAEMSATSDATFAR